MQKTRYRVFQYPLENYPSLASVLLTRMHMKTIVSRIAIIYNDTYLAYKLLGIMDINLRNNGHEYKENLDITSCYESPCALSDSNSARSSSTILSLGTSRCLNKTKNIY